MRVFVPAIGHAACLCAGDLALGVTVSPPTLSFLEKTCVWAVYYEQIRKSLKKLGCINVLSIEVGRRVVRRPKRRAGSDLPPTGPNEDGGT